jgi:hypothetical protein
MKNVLLISEGESQLLKVKRKTSLSSSLHGSWGESRTQKTAKKNKLFQKIQSFIQKKIVIPSKNDIRFEKKKKKGSLHCARFELASPAGFNSVRIGKQTS